MTQIHEFKDPPLKKKEAPKTKSAPKIKGAPKIRIPQKFLENL